jgi:hypothetical protein
MGSETLLVVLPPHGKSKEKPIFRFKSRWRANTILSNVRASP